MSELNHCSGIIPHILDQWAIAAYSLSLCSAIAACTVTSLTVLLVLVPEEPCSSNACGSLHAE